MTDALILLNFYCYEPIAMLQRTYALKDFMVRLTAKRQQPLKSVFNNVVAAIPPTPAHTSLVAGVAANQHLLLLPIGIKTNGYLPQKNTNIVDCHPTTEFVNVIAPTNLNKTLLMLKPGPNVNVAAAT
jgi:hypothetical protein